MSTEYSDLIVGNEGSGWWIIIKILNKVAKYMSEVLFVLVVVFVAYVAYTVLTDKGAGNTVTHLSPEDSPAEPAAPETPVAESPAQSVSQETVVVDSPAPEAASAPLVDELKNPKTGEVSKVPNNYRFGKRWIKEALVAEGLLDRVYKNNELKGTVEAKIHMAMAALIAMDKYKV
jgi:hypothetical protein